jgi:hypothetical protein
MEHLNNKARVIAFYLPQFHPIPENDMWWGKGFTEWTNVGKAKSLFRGHYQPRVPADLGYYDLRLSEVFEMQAELAREAGVEGFCFWHYWFGNGKRLLERPFNEILASGKPNFPFCLGWANHSWKAKNWNSSGVKGKDTVLMEQTYPGKSDYKAHFFEVLPAFKDPRYIYIDGKPLFYIHGGEYLPIEFIGLWNHWAKENGLNGIYFVGQLRAKTPVVSGKDIMRSRGFDAVSTDSFNQYYFTRNKMIKLLLRLKSMVWRHTMFVVDYEYASNYFLDSRTHSLEDVIPHLLPNFDHSPRSGKHAYILHNSTPELFKKHVKKILDIVAAKENKLVFLKSWNEWAEGNYMEPDLKFGKGYIKALREALDENEE